MEHGDLFRIRVLLAQVFERRVGVLVRECAVENVLCGRVNYGESAGRSNYGELYGLADRLDLVTRGPEHRAENAGLRCRIAISSDDSRGRPVMLGDIDLNLMPIDATGVIEPSRGNQ